MLSCVSPHLLFLVKKLFTSFERMDGLITENLPASSFGWWKMWKHKESANMDTKPRHERIGIDNDLLSYASDNGDRAGVYIAAQPLSPDHNYFEVEVLDTGLSCGIAIGLVPQKYPLDKQPGCLVDSVAYHLEDGKLYKGRSRGSTFIAKGEVGDRIGCGIRFEQAFPLDQQRPVVPVFFTKNGKEISVSLVHWTSKGLFPAIGMTSVGEEVRLTLHSQWFNEEETQMSIDGHEEEWSRLHDIILNGQVLEYTGRGKSITDVGLAQARWPLNTTSHYFEIEIVDPGENCFIAIGLARKNYPKHRHPGWNTGSIAYHADDGKIFSGSGVGDPFGPRCHKGDVMGCGIIFPRDYSCSYDSDGSQELSPSSPNDAEVEDDSNQDDYEAGSQSESEDDLWWNNCEMESNSKVQVFFTRNGKTIGRKEVRIPKGGFYPTVGMLSLAEKVKVDLRPLSG